MATSLSTKNRGSTSAAAAFGGTVSSFCGSGGGTSKKFSAVNVLFIVCGALMSQSMIFLYCHGRGDDDNNVGGTALLMMNNPTGHAASSLRAPLTSISSSSSQLLTDEQIRILRESNPLAIPPGKARNLPSIRHNDTSLNVQRNIYGGEGDAKHLGGFTEIDKMGLSPAVWKYMVQNMTIKSVLDVGCGRGISTSWFYSHGLRTQCAEGSHDAVTKTMVPDKSLVVEHDFSRGPWWPEQTFDAAWAVEFLEHVGVQYHYNYISAFRKAAILMVTSSRWGGWHHVEVHPDEWWIQKYEMYGFRYSESLTKKLRQLAAAEARTTHPFPPTGGRFAGQHIFTSMKVFINPMVASLPEHAHLFANHGCYKGAGPGGILDIVNRECGTGVEGETESRVDPSYLPLKLVDEQDLAWYKIVEDNIDKSKIDKH